MCGIAGFIGDSTNYNLSYKLISNIFKNLQIRGEDASGFWGVLNKNNIIYHKEPQKSSDFCLKNNYWKQLKDNPSDIVITHARGASADYGLPELNVNNHPFLNVSKNVALIHNGKINKFDYDFISKFFKLKSKCDSELYLKFVENNNIIDGIKDIWSYLYDSHMAVAIAQYLNKNNKNLYLFKNKYRSLWIADVRQYLNQIFFVSTKEIWEKSICDLKFNFDKAKLIEIHPDELYEISLINKNFIINKYNINIKKKYWVGDLKFSSNVKKVKKHKVITGLDKKDVIIK